MTQLKIFLLQMIPLLPDLKKAKAQKEGKAETIKQHGHEKSKHASQREKRLKLQGSRFVLIFGIVYLEEDKMVTVQLCADQWGIFYADTLTAAFYESKNICLLMIFKKLMLFFFSLLVPNYHFTQFSWEAHSALSFTGFDLISLVCLF